MIQPDEHCTSEELQLLADGSPVNEQHVREHLGRCVRCRTVFTEFSRLHHALQSLPLERASPEFTHRVLSRLYIPVRTPLMFRAIGYLGYCFGFAIVLGIMLGVFLFTGVVNSGHIETGQTIIGELSGKVGSLIVETALLIGIYVPAFGSGAINISAIVLLVLIMLGITDRFIGRKLSGRSVV